MGNKSNPNRFEIRFREWLIREGKTENTIKSYVKVVRYFETWYESVHVNELIYRDLNPVDAREWKNYLVTEARKSNGESLSVRTINNYIESLTTFFKFLKEIKEISLNPMDSIKPQVVNSKYTPRWLEANEKNLVLQYIEDPILKEKNPWKYSRNKFIVFSMLYGGLRISETLSLTIFDCKNGYLQIREGKGQAARKVPMNKSLANALEEWLIQRNERSPQSEYLLLSQKGGKLTETGIYSFFSKIVEKTRLKNLTPHTLRHTFAHDLIQIGHPLTYVAALLGHNDLDTTRIYISPKK